MNKTQDFVVTFVIVAILAAILGIFVAAQDDNTSKNSVPAQNVVEVSEKPVLDYKRPALPTTLAGFQRAFDDLPAHSWGGGDIAVTEVLDDGRAVWFFGDTVTRRGGHVWLNRNTALVQTGEDMHASNAGTQIIPSENKGKTVYWPLKVDETAKPGLLNVWTSKIRAGNGGPWDFERVRDKEARVARVLVDEAGNMTFLGWIGWMPNPNTKDAAPADGSDTRILGPGHWGYQKIVHEDLPLTGGQSLVTESQNWDNGHKVLVDYRPMLSATD